MTSLTRLKSAASSPATTRAPAATASARGPRPAACAALTAPGHALDTPLRKDMERAFGRDFSSVRVHDDGVAASAAQALDARAYTFGRNIVFGAGQYAPQQAAGRRLLAHELAHVVQQSAAPATVPARLDAEDSPHERSADTAADAVMRGGMAAPVPAAVNGIQRQPNAAAGSQAATDPREQIIRLGESETAADRQQALDLILQTYYTRPDNFDGIVYNPNLHSSSPQDAETGPSSGQPQYGGQQSTYIGPRFFRHFRERYDQRVRTIGHELQHVGQRSPPSERTVGGTFGAIGLGLGGGALLGAAGLGIAAAAGASLSAGIIGGVIGGAAALGGLVLGLADPFKHRDDPITDRNTREFLAIHWTLTAQVRGIAALPPGQALTSINHPSEGALYRYQHMSPQDQQRYRRQYEEVLRIKEQMEQQNRQGGSNAPAAPAHADITSAPADEAP
ncbi:MAG: DUF4157 domain-containing protein [Nevskia sp.]|nr:DUF4157 domain-containing protein [Nevskia sp.]